MTRKLQAGGTPLGRGVAGFVDVVGILYRTPEPLSVKEVSQLSEHCLRTVDRYIFLLKEEGLIGMVGKRGNTRLYQWVGK